MQHGLRHDVLYHPKKANLVKNALSQPSMGSVSHVEDDKKESFCDIHRLAQLGVNLVDYNIGGVVVYNGSKSSLYLM
ncbi:hypothetical protein MTR67_002827 [Solanum verrucosum]|uniref:Uncharacterized protein n=1 Tax=Solanum verrucosum TaxID=315347 RepID=A0AAF0T6B0_SOLVR|nr:hypothetical protein MTR67_002827 [Solanum verrucosum]